MDKPIAAFLQSSAGFMLFAAGAFGGDAVLLVAPALVSGAAGLWLWGRAAREKLGAAVTPKALGTADNRVEEILVSLQEDVARLREDRGFYKELYSSTEKQAELRSSGPPTGPV